MSMTPRIARLRAASIAAEPSISAERAELLTAFYRENEGRYPVPVLRALAFKHLCAHRTITIGPGELIVGERGPTPKATPTYPELTCHSLEDLRILATREKTRYRVDEACLAAYEERIIPYWRGRTMRERIFGRMEPEWLACYEAGLFTEFMEQRAPGHTSLDGKIYRRGLLDLKHEIAQQLAALDAGEDPTAGRRASDFAPSGAGSHARVSGSAQPLSPTDLLCEDAGDSGSARPTPRAWEPAPLGGEFGRGLAPRGRLEDRRAELQAMDISCDAVILFAERHAELARQMAAQEPDPVRREELARIAEVCARVPAHAPRTFWEALQTYWFVHLGVISEMNGWDAFNPGHLDQHLGPFYEADLRAGALDREGARELLECLWVKFNNQPAPPKVGVTAAESGTHNDFVNINIGGVDEAGADAVNEVSYLLLEVIEEMHLLQPGTNIQLSAQNPDPFLHAACRVIGKGYGYPAVFNADQVVAEQVRVGKSLADARGGGTSGCVETGCFGKEAYVLTGYLNLPKLLELALHDGRDPRTGRQVGPRTGDPCGWRSYGELYAAFEAQLRHAVTVKLRGNEAIERLYAAEMPAPFLSVLIDDCIARGRDYNAGGARYNTRYIQGVGIGTIADSLSALKKHVYGGDLGMAALLQALQSDFADEGVRLLLANRTPRYGNDDDEADALMQQVFESFYRAVEGQPNVCGGEYHIDMLPTTCHIYFGAVTGALPDGRRAGKPLSEGISPVQGADRRGPTAVVRSAAKMDHVRTGGTLLNQKLLPALVRSDTGIERLAQLIRGYFSLGGHHIQFNVVDGQTLRAAQANPQQYRDLIVRVAGYSDYFCDLGTALQEEIIARTEQACL